MNRRDQAKLRKKYNKGRYARFSGSSVRHIKGSTRTVEVLEHEGEDKVKLKYVEVFVGQISLSKGVVNTGRGLDPERMQEYYRRVTPESKAITLKEDLGIKDPRYKQHWMDTPTTNRLNLASTKSGRLDMYWHGSVYFAVELDYVRKIIRRSRDYGKKERLYDAIRRNNLTWEDEIPMD